MSKQVTDQNQLDSLYWIGLALERNRKTWEHTYNERQEQGDTAAASHALRVLEEIEQQIEQHTAQQDALRERGIELSWLVNPR